MNKEKPMVVEINRFYRPKEMPKNGKSFEHVIASNRGVTIMFTLNYETRQFTARYSICNGDNFSKATGICYAQACENPITGDITPGWSLYDMLTNQIVNILSVPAELQNKKFRRNVEMLGCELVASI